MANSNLLVFIYSLTIINIEILIVYRTFETLRQYFSAQSESIPMSFALGFYVNLIVGRWWDQYKLLPWPDTLALVINAAIQGDVCFELFVFYFFYFNFGCLCTLIRKVIKAWTNGGE